MKVTARLVTEFAGNKFNAREKTAQLIEPIKGVSNVRIKLCVKREETD